MHRHYDKKVLFQAPVFAVKNSVGHQRLRSGRLLHWPVYHRPSCCYLETVPNPRGKRLEGHPPGLSVIGAEFARVGMKGPCDYFSIIYRCLEIS